MSLTKHKYKTPHSSTTKVYPTWEKFVEEKVDKTNELLSKMDQDALTKLIKAKRDNAH